MTGTEEPNSPSLSGTIATQDQDHRQPDDLVAAAVSDVEVGLDEDLLPKKAFLPWHLPRKHFCRLRQWARNVQRLSNDLGLDRPQRMRPIRYLSLPGDELLDIRVLAPVARACGTSLQFLAFNNATTGPRKAESDLSFAEVRQMDGVHGGPSEVLQLHLEQIADDSSVAQRRVKEHLPFDVVNLDFTSSVVADKPLSDMSTFQALRWLIELQCTRASTPWVLFLTTPLARDRTNDMTARQLWAQVDANCERADFDSALQKAFGFDGSAVRGEIEGSVRLGTHAYAFGLAVAVGKWILGILDTRDDNWSVTVLDSMSYRVYGDSPEMFSLSLRFEPHAIFGTDATGLTHPPKAAPPPSEAEQANALLSAIAGTIDVDDWLRRHPEELAKAVDLTSKLLAAVRYDAADYSDWARSEMSRRGL